MELLVQSLIEEFWNNYGSLWDGTKTSPPIPSYKILLKECYKRKWIASTTYDVRFEVIVAIIKFHNQGLLLFINFRLILKL